ncbi:MAG: response regulator [Deltaproteobacteria bacterium]|nr:response regulator [Deltaproteobacteria bacterium]
MNLAPDLSQARILMVDDTPQNLKLLGLLLRQQGYRLSAARNGHEALEVASAAAPDLILLDVAMPGLDGFATCQRLKADPALRDVPIIFLTAAVDHESVMRGFSVGAVDYVTKPFEAEELLARVRTHLELRFARARLFDLANKLGRYLSPQVYASIFSGERDVRIESYRRDLTVFFGDIANFTRTAERMSEADLTRWLNGYLDEMARIALRHGGTLDKFIGDGMMVFFGDPTSRGLAGDAQACVQMALDMQRAARRLGIAVRMGIAAGSCTVGNFGCSERMEYTIIGRPVNLAARLQSVAHAGQILISETVFDRVGGALPCTLDGIFELKGLEEGGQGLVGRRWPGRSRPQRLGVAWKGGRAVEPWGAHLSHPPR